MPFRPNPATHNSLFRLIFEYGICVFYQANEVKCFDEHDVPKCKAESTNAIKKIITQGVHACHVLYHYAGKIK